MSLIQALLLSTALTVLTWDHAHATAYPHQQHHRRLNLIQSPMYASVRFGATPNLNITDGNPLKGFLSNPDYFGKTKLIPTDRIDPSLEFRYISMFDVMKNGSSFNWTVPDATIAFAKNNSRHVIWRFYLDYPRNLTNDTRRPNDVPQYLIDAGLTMYRRNFTSKTPGSEFPDYTNKTLRTNSTLLDELKKFIRALGKRYDGNVDVGFIQLGLVGRWGEWHTSSDNATNTSIPENMKAELVSAFSTAFNKTKLQTRYERLDALSAKIGIHDDGFGLSTIGKSNSLWTKIEALGFGNFWRDAPMGGETDPLVEVTTFSGNFSLYVNVTHPTYISCTMAFKENLTATQLATVKQEHVRMGYNFFVSNITAAFSTRMDRVMLIATLRQVGLAPFYYPLRLNLTCNGVSFASLSNVESLNDTGLEKDFAFRGVPTSCLGNASLVLSSPYLMPGRPIKFAHQNHGKATFKFPAPNETNKGQIFIDALSMPGTGDRFNVSGSGGSPGIDEILNSTSWVEQAANGAIGTCPAHRYHREFFRVHRWGANLTYVISNFTANSFHYITLGFAETYSPNCVNGSRVFNVVVGSNYTISALDVHAKAGCKRGFVLHTQPIQADGKGEIPIRFQAIAGKNNPMVAFILAS
jgi:Malectin domain